jgi:hypothetical protein
VSEDTKNKPESGNQLPIPSPKPEVPQPGRRLFIFRATALLSGAVAALSGGSRLAEAQRTDRDPTDGIRRGKGVTDNDPTDRAGRGSDNDPTDRGGKGRGSGSVDRDPTDRAGRGKGVTDNDPTDARGRGSDRDPTDARGKGRGG